MKQIIENVFFCGLPDKNRKLFDQLVPLPQGTTYNAYVVKGSEKVALIDTMYEKLRGEFVDMIAASGMKIDYIISNHAEPDHSGSIGALLEKFPQAVVYASPKCAENLKNMLHIPEAKIKVVSEGEELPLGGKTLRFMITPWVHWPDTMFTYLVEDKLLFSCDFFGAHYTKNDLWADCTSGLAEAAKRYYAEIMMPFRNFCVKYLKMVKALEPKMILPSHGPVYDHPEFILNLYEDWTSERVAKKILLPYVSMYDNTREMVDYLENILQAEGVTVVKADLIEADEGEIAMELIDAAGVVFGTSMVLTGPHPKTVYAAYLINILRPKIKFYTVVGSFGWGGNLTAPVDAMFTLTKPEKLDGVIVKGKPRVEDFKALDNLANTLLQKLL